MSEALFVGRERETDLYRKFLARKTPWVLIITGLGGIGKSTLLHRLADYTLTEPTLSKTGIVALDFADEELRNDPLKLLDKLAKDTAPHCDVQQIDVELENELHQNSGQLAQLSKERIQAGVSEAEDPALREMRHQMRQLATEAFYTQIKTFTLDRLVVMLDTCEWLNEPEGIEVGQWVLNELIPGIHTRIRQKGRQCSVVMASRLQPRLDAINGQDQRRLTLPMLGKVEVDQYLEHMGMQDPDLRQRVYEVTHGHALCISIIGNFWQNRDEQKQPFTIADFSVLQEFSEKALIQFTNERILKQLKSPFKELTRYGVLLRSFDLPLLKIVFPELLPETAALERFNQLIRYPYVESRGNYRYAFHELVHEALAEETQREEPEEWKRYHERALDHFTSISPHSPDRYYHLLAYDEKQGLVEWQQAIQEARESGKLEYVGALLQAALDKALKLSSAARAEVVYEQGRFYYYGGQWEEALKSYKEVLASFQEVEDHSGQAKVLAAMGDVQRVLAKQDDALKSYENAIATFQQIGDLFGEAKCCQAMGDVLRLRNDLGDALQRYQQAFDLFRRIGNQPEQAKVLEALGDVQRLRDEQDAALRSYEQALALYQEEKDRPKRAKVLKAIGDVHRLQQDQDAALESYAQALALFGELKEPADEANVRRAMEELQQPQGEQKALPGEKSVFQIEPPVPAAPQRRRGFLGAWTILSIVLALLIVAGSCAWFLILSGHAPATMSNAIAIATLQAQASTSAQAFAVATEQVIATSTGQAVATATEQAIATATASQNLYTQITGGSPVLNDPLKDSSRGNGWLVEHTSSSDCIFTRGAYHARITNQNHFFVCFAVPSNFSNFAFQVQMTIIKGDVGGIAFRANDTETQFYYFGIGQDGSYFLFRYAANNPVNSRNNPDPHLARGFSPVIHTGLNQHNLLTVIARGSNLYLFVNQQYITTVTDSTYSAGEIGAVAESTKNPTDVMFSNAQVWTL